jgi:hypothetical protein
METVRQGTTLFTAICVLIGTLVVIQLWLVSAALDALLGEQTGILIPAALASLALFALNGGLLLYVVRFDQRLRNTGSSNG